MKTINLFYIGDNYYMESGTMMSPIYEEVTLRRYDWGFVQVALRQGSNVTIRQATKKESEWAEQQLKSIQELS